MTNRNSGDIMHVLVAEAPYVNARYFPKYYRKKNDEALSNFRKKRTITKVDNEIGLSTSFP